MVSSTPQRSFLAFSWEKAVREAGRMWGPAAADNSLPHRSGEGGRAQRGRMRSPLRREGNLIHRKRSPFPAAAGKANVRFAGRKAPSAVTRRGTDGRPCVHFPTKTRKWFIDKGRAPW